MRTLSLVFVIVFLCLPSLGQEDDSVLRVPDLTGMTFPAAVAELERLGLDIGEETVQVHEQNDPATDVNRIIEQTPTAGTVVQPGDLIDVRVVREVALRLVYDNNDITFINPTDSSFTIGRLAFRSIGSATAASFTFRDIAGWSPMLDADECYQLWSVSRTSAKAVAGCPPVGLIPWAFRTNRALHFWTGTNGAPQFEVLQDDVVRATCDIAAGACDVYSAEYAGYIYLRYTTDQLLILNTSETGWMSLAGFDAAPDRLAPGQCVRFKVGVVESQSSDDCDVVAEITLEESFWDAGLDVGAERACPAPLDGETMICLLAR